MTVLLVGKWLHSCPKPCQPTSLSFLLLQQQQRPITSYFGINWFHTKNRYNNCCYRSLESCSSYRCSRFLSMNTTTTTTITTTTPAAPTSPIGRTFGTTTTTSVVRNQRTDDRNLAKQDKDYCVKLVKERDGEGYLCGLLLPASSRNAYFALRAFNVELASIKDGHKLRNQGMTNTTNINTTTANIPDSTLALQLRMAFWRDAIEDICQNKSNNNNSTTTSSSARPAQHSLSGLMTSHWNSPVVRALDRAHTKHNFTHRFLERIVDAREIDLETNQFLTVNELTGYGEETVSSLLYLTLEIFSIRDTAADQCVSAAGVGIALTTALRATPYRLATSGGTEIPIPAELLRPGYPYQKLTEDYMSSMDQTPTENNNGESDSMPFRSVSEHDVQLWQDAIREMAQEAVQYLYRARDLQGNIPKSARGVLLPVVPALRYLETLNKANHNVFDSSVMVGAKSDRLKLLWLLGRTWMTGVL